jgi:hypothetical protein
MQTGEFTLPEDAELVDRLAGAFAAGCTGSRALRIIERRKNYYDSTYPTEIVLLSLNGETQQCMFVKYEAGRHEPADGHRRSVGYEVDVYRQILVPLGVSVPRFYAGLVETRENKSWIAVEYIDPAIRINETADAHGMIRAAEWIGDFHKKTASLASDPRLASILVYDSEYLMRWPAKLLAQDLSGIKEAAGIAEIMARFQSEAALLCSDQVIVHGEYCPANILCANDTIFPVDWQSTAIGAGEVDLALLTEGAWGSEIVAGCERAYAAARWPHGAPDHFRKRLALARMYWTTRVLSDWRWRIGTPLYLRTFNELLTAYRDLGLT